MGTAANLSATAGAPQRRRDNLAQVYQETLTAIARFRSNPQSITDAESFRAQFRAALKSAEQEGAARGYLPEDVRLATFAAVAFLDESILNAHNPVLTDWARRPLQEEMFGVHVAGEIFFRNLERLLARPDSHDLADVLEVYQLCVLLGFRGRFSIGGAGELRTFGGSAAEKIRRIRGHSTHFSDAWRPPAEAPRRMADAWVRRLFWIAVGCCGVALLLFVIFKVALGSGLGEIQAVADRIRL